MSCLVRLAPISDSGTLISNRSLLLLLLLLLFHRQASSNSATHTKHTTSNKLRLRLWRDWPRAATGEACDYKLLLFRHLLVAGAAVVVVVVVLIGYRQLRLLWLMQAHDDDDDGSARGAARVIEYYGFICKPNQTKPKDRPTD